MHKFCVECILHTVILDCGRLVKKTQVIVFSECVCNMTADVPLVWTPAPQFSWAPLRSLRMLHGTSWHLRHLCVFHLQFQRDIIIITGRSWSVSALEILISCLNKKKTSGNPLSWKMNSFKLSGPQSDNIFLFNFFLFIRINHFTTEKRKVNKGFTGFKWQEVKQIMPEFSGELFL